MTTAPETTSRSARPSAAKRGGGLLLTAGLVGSGIVLAAPGAHADDHFNSTNDVPLQHVDEDTAGGYGPDASLEDSEGPTDAGDYYNADENDFWAPAPQSRLLGSQDPGNQSIGSAEETGLFAGQSLRYEVQIDLGEYDALDEAYDGQASFQLRDRIPAGVSVDTDSFEIHDSQGEHGTGALLTGDQFDVEIRGDNNDLLIVSNIDEDILSGNNTLYLSYDASLSEDVELYQELESAPYQYIQVPVPFEVETDEDGEPVIDEETGEPVQVESDETHTYEFFTDPISFEVLGADPTQSVSDLDGEAVDGRTAVGGDVVVFDVTLDGTFAGEVEVYDEENDENNIVQAHTNPAYDIDSFGLVETFDPDVLQIEADTVSISGNPGDYEVSVDNDSGELRVFVDDPEAWVDSDHTVSYQAVVQDAGESTSASVQTTQVIDDNEFSVEEVESFPVESIAPSKGAFTIEDGEAEEVDSIAQNAQFFYGISNSETPEDPLYPLDTWGVSDVYTSGDRALHENWQVIADVDITDADGEVVFAAGSVIADDSDTTYFEKRPEGDSFDLVATNRFTELVGTFAAQWTAYVGVTRTAEAGGEVSNTANEVRNGYSRSATITTGTDGAIVIDPALSAAEEVEAGETIEVTGTGFTPGGEVSFDYGETTAEADEDGEVSVELEIAEDADLGEVEVTATDEASEETASVTFEVVSADEDEASAIDPSISVADEVAQGESLEVTGSGFTAEGEVEVSLNPDVTTSADSNGDFSVDLEVAEDAETGDAEVIATDVETGEQASATVTIVASEEVPSDDEGGDNVNGEGTGSGGEASDDGASPQDEVSSASEDEGSSDGRDAQPAGSMSDPEDEDSEDQERNESDEERDPQDEAVSSYGSPGTGGTGSDGTGSGGSDASDQRQAAENLSQTGASSPWLIGGGALALLLSGAGLLAWPKIRARLNG